MKAALELLQALRVRWPSRHGHCLRIAADGKRLTISLDVKPGFQCNLDPVDMEKPAAQLVEEIAPLLESKKKEVKAVLARIRGRKRS